MSSIDDCIKNGIPWPDLPANIQESLSNDPAEYDARVLVYFLQNQLKYSGGLIRNVLAIFIYFFLFGRLFVVKRHIILSWFSTVLNK